MDVELTAGQMERLRELRERELTHESHQYYSIGVHFGPGGVCVHCGDPATCRDRRGEGCCRECWLELTGGLIPPPEILSNAPHKPANVSITTLQRMPRDSRVDYFGDSWEDDG